MASKIMEHPSNIPCCNMHITQNNDHVKSSVTADSDGECSPPRKKTIQRKKKQKDRKIPRNISKESKNET